MMGDIDDLGPRNDDPLVDDFTAKCQRCRYEYDIFAYSMCPKCLSYLALKAANTIDIFDDQFDTPPPE